MAPKRNRQQQDQEEQPDPEMQAEEEDPPAPAEDNDDDDDEEEDNGNAEQRKKNRKKRSRAVARRKGYRYIANRAGYSATLPSADASRDVTSNLLSISETVRACRWTPRLPNAVTYGGEMDEYKRRMKLSTESLPPKAAAVIRGNAEVFARRIMDEAVQRSFDAGKTRVSANTMMSVLRPLQPVLDFSFVAPMGLVRHAQTTIVGAEGKQAPALAFGPDDDAQMKAEATWIPKQEAFAKQISKKQADKRAERAAKIKAKKDGDNAAAAPPQAKKTRARA